MRARDTPAARSSSPCRGIRPTYSQRSANGHTRLARPGLDPFAMPGPGDPNLSEMIAVAGHALEALQRHPSSVLRAMCFRRLAPQSPQADPAPSHIRCPCE
jgi:hypothetical protein